ncbi:MAG: NUDIX hydrolase [Elusimicrobiota bacterium]
MKKIIEKNYREKRIYKGKAISFMVDTVILPNGKKATREFMDHPGAVAVLAVNKKNEIIFVQQYRYPVNKITYEIPAGKLNFKGDNFLKRARAELMEETGYTARRLNHLIDFWPTPAFSNEILRIYIARDLKKGAASPDEDEFLNVKKIKDVDALKMIKKGDIKDSKTIIAVFYYFLFVKKVSDLCVK